MIYGNCYWNSNNELVCFTDENGIEYEILFSRISGQHSTYKIIGQNIDIFGEDAAEYFDDFDGGSW